MRVIVFLLMLVFPLPAMSMTAVVRGGDHDGFTRIVISLEHEDRWELRQNGRKVLIDLHKPNIVLQVRDVFSRINKNRVANVQVGGDTLILHLACDCIVRGNSLGPDLVVLDIRTGSMPWQPPFLDQHKSPNPRSDYLPQIVLEPPIEDHAKFGTAERVVDNLERMSAPTRFGQFFPFSNYSIDIGALGGPSRLQAMEERLVRQLGQATTQGLLEPDLSFGSGREDPASTAPGQEELTKNQSTPVDHNQLTHPQSMAAVSSTLPQLGCETQGIFNIANWGREGRYSHDLSQIRSELYGEFDKINTAAWLKLARLYLFHGMGAEARQAAAHIDEMLHERAAIGVISGVLEAAENNQESVNSFLVFCDTEVSLWSFLSLSHPPEITESKAKDLLKNLSRLPVRLISILSPMMSQKLRDQGYTELAGLAIRQSTWLGSGTSAQQFQAAIQDVESSAEGAGRNGLRDVALSHTEEAPIALAEYVRLAVENGEEISSDTVTLAESYAKLHRSGPLSQLMSKTYALSLASNRRFAEADEEIDSLKGLGALEDGIEPAFYKLLTSNANDVTFLYFASEISDQVKRSLPKSVRFQMARRLLDLGFVEIAHDLIGQVSYELLSADERDFLAMISVAGRYPYLALTLLNTYGEQLPLEFSASLTEIAMGQPAALDIYNELGDSASVDRLAWNLPTNFESDLVSRDYRSFVNLSNRDFSFQESSISGAENLLRDTLELTEKILALNGREAR